MLSTPTRNNAKLSASPNPEIQTRLSIILPCYNEAKNIALIFARIVPLLSDREDIEVILVNNGSQDDSSAVMERELQTANLRSIRLCHVPVNRGYGYGIMSGIREAQGEFIAWTHADLQTDPADVVTALEKMLQEDNPKQTFLKGQRCERPFLDEIFTRGMAMISSFALGVPLFDINAQPKLFHRSFLPYLAVPPDDFSLDLYALYQAQKHGFRMLKQDVHFGQRKFGIAKGGGTFKGKVKLVQRTWRYIFQLRSEIRQGTR